MIQKGDRLPHFTLKDDAGREVTHETLSSGKWVVYFYPKDDTPGCTNEAVSFENVRAELERLGYGLMGVSADSTESHQAFKKKYSLNFPLLSDPQKTLIESCGMWIEKKNFGKTYYGISRSTLLLDEGEVMKIYKQVKPTGHGMEVLDDIRQMQNLK